MPSRTANILMPVCAFKFTRYVAYLIRVHTSFEKSVASVLVMLRKRRYSVGFPFLPNECKPDRNKYMYMKDVVIFG